MNTVAEGAHRRALATVMLVHLRRCALMWEGCIFGRSICRRVHDVGRRVVTQTWCSVRPQAACLLLSRPHEPCLPPHTTPSLSTLQHFSGMPLPLPLPLPLPCSYENMGLARVECVEGCACPPAALDTLWRIKASIFYAFAHKVGRGGSEGEAEGGRGVGVVVVPVEPACACSQPSGRQQTQSVWYGEHALLTRPPSPPRFQRATSGDMEGHPSALPCVSSSSALRRTMMPLLAVPLPRPQVTQHPRCRLRVTIEDEPGRAQQQAHKVSLTGPGVG